MDNKLVKHVHTKSDDLTKDKSVGCGWRTERGRCMMCKIVFPSIGKGRGIVQDATMHRQFTTVANVILMQQTGQQGSFGYARAQGALKLIWRR